MMTTSNTTTSRLRYHHNAYQFVFAALRYTQGQLRRSAADEPEDEERHISGAELLEGIRRLGIRQFGLMARTVFRHWGVHSTGDFGRVVFELIERGEMRKTEGDQLGDFFDLFDFEDVFDHQYQVDTTSAFRE